jgi:hypothetical protein
MVSDYRVLRAADWFRADLTSEPGRAVSHQDLVGQARHHRARYADRMGETFEGADGAGEARAAVHDRCVELKDAENVRPASRPDAPHLGIGLNEPDAGLDGIETCGSFPQEPGCCCDAGRAFAVGEKDHGFSSLWWIILVRNR